MRRAYISSVLKAASWLHGGPGQGTFAWRTAARAAAAPPDAMAMIKQLRSNTGAPIADVKACLAEAGWDLAAAAEALRLRGMAAAVKKATRHASEGLVGVAQDGLERVAVVEINSETDFVGRSQPFQQLLSAAAQAALRMSHNVPAGEPYELEITQLGATPVLEQGGSGGVQEACAQLAAQVRENIALRRGYAMVAGAHGVVSSYVHMPVSPGAGRIAAVVALDAGRQLKEPERDELGTLASELAMHAAGLGTQHISRERIDASVLAATRADLASATAAQMPGKPAAVLEKIVDGKLAKWCKERFILDDSVTVAQLLVARGAALGLPKDGLRVAALLRLQVGEGMERRDATPDFAAEVAAMAGGRA